MGVSKVTYGNQTILDLTSDTVTPETLCQGYTAYNAAGELITGTNPASPAAATPGTPGVSKVMLGDRVLIDLTGTTVHSGALLEGVTAHTKSGSSVVGTMVPYTPFEFPFSNESLTENMIIFTS